MKAITIWQPWASLIAVGAKAYETRGWRPPADLIGERIAIHASVSVRGMDLLQRDTGILSMVCRHRLGPDPLPMGGVIATAVLSFVVTADGALGREVVEEERALGDWSPGRYAWRLSDVVLLTRLVPCRGRQGIFSLTTDESDSVLRFHPDRP